MRDAEVDMSDVALSASFQGYFKELDAARSLTHSNFAVRRST
jgi:hypothetical protein